MSSKHSAGYLVSYKPSSQSADKRGRIYEHRLVMEECLGRPLNPTEIIHHIDENKTNNSLSNLAILSRRDHTRLHFGWKLIDGEWWKLCWMCKQLLQAETYFYRRSSGAYTSECKKCARELDKQRRKEKSSAKSML